MGNLNHLDTAIFHLAIVQARGNDYLQSIQKLYQSVDEVQTFYDNLSQECQQPIRSTNDLQLSSEDVIISPNPADDSSIKIDISEEQPGAYFCTFSNNNERIKTSNILIH